MVQYFAFLISTLANILFPQDIYLILCSFCLVPEERKFVSKKACISRCILLRDTPIISWTKSAKTLTFLICFKEVTALHFGRNTTHPDGRCSWVLSASPSKFENNISTRKRLFPSKPIPITSSLTHCLAFRFLNYYQYRKIEQR